MFGYLIVASDAEKSRCKMITKSIGSRIERDKITSLNNLLIQHSVLIRSMTCLLFEETGEMLRIFKS